MKIMKILNSVILALLSGLVCASIVLYILEGVYALSSRIVFSAALISVIIFIALNYRTIPAFFRRSGTLTGLNRILQLISIIGILVFAYLLSGIIPLKLDLTASRIYSLSPETVNIINSLTNDINVYYFKPADKSDQVLDYIGNLLRIYSEKNGHLKLTTADPNINRSLADRYNVNEPGAVVFDNSGITSTVSAKKVVTVDPETGWISDYRGESAYTLALKSITAGRMPDIYILQGHGEIDISEKGDRGYSEIASLMKEQGLNIRLLSLMSFPEIPSDCGLLIIGDPVRTFSADELDRIDHFINQGGSVLVLLELETHITVNDILRQMGLYYYQNLAIEDQDYLPQYGRTTVLPTILYHEITWPLMRGKLGVVMPLACGIDTIPEKGKDVRDEFYLTPLLKTSKNSFGEVSIKKIKTGEVSPDRDDIQGPLVIGYAARKMHSDISISRKGEITNRYESRMVVFGDCVFINNAYVTVGGNSDLFLNAVNYLLRREEEITIRPKSTAMKSFQLSSSEQRLMSVITAAVFLMYILPGIIITIGRKGHVKS